MVLEHDPAILQSKKINREQHFKNIIDSIRHRKNDNEFITLSIITLGRAIGASCKLEDHHQHTYQRQLCLRMYRS